MNSNAVDNTDRVFFDCLREIERSYLCLSKQLRIRVEKWVEKLISTGNNEVWRKHRNAYAKLLLSMILGKSLTDPFHILPGDGPLPSYPFHLKSFSKNLLGPHESIFWHELYHRLQNTDHEHDHDETLTLGNTVRVKVKEESSTTLTTLPQSREISNLNLLIKEQAKRIQLLEQQLHDERMQHELQIQRMHYTHRVDVGTLKNELSKSMDAASFYGHAIHNSTFDANLSHASPVRVTASMPTFPSGPSGMPGMRRSGYDDHSQSASQATSSYAHHQSHVHPHVDGVHNRSRPTRLFEEELSTSRLLHVQPIETQQQQDSTGPANSNDSRGSAVYDITPTPDKKFSFTASALNPALIYPADSISVSSAQPAAADPFFASLDAFQSEIQRINSTLQSAMAPPLASQRSSE